MSLLNTTLLSNLESGSYSARITSYEEITPENKKPFILVTLQLSDREITDKWYESRLRYIMYGLRNQLNLTSKTTSLVDLLEAAKIRDICITIDYSPEYGMQISYPAEEA